MSSQEWEQNHSKGDEIVSSRKKNVRQSAMMNNT